MVKTVNSKNRLRDLWANDVDTMALGTGSTPITGTETSIEGEDANTEFTPTVVKSEKTVKTTHTLPSTVGNGVDYNKIGIKTNDGNTLDDIMIFPTYSQTDTTELITTVTTRFS
jgi:hypothetical protein